MAKTVIDYIHLIRSNDVRSKALNNIKQEKREVKVSSTADAILEAFDWDVTPEGTAYWLKIFQFYLKNTPRTIKEWFEQLEEPYRSQALYNLLERNTNGIVSTAHIAINSGFTWSETPEGQKYWSDYHKSLNEIEKNL